MRWCVWLAVLPYAAGLTKSGKGFGAPTKKAKPKARKVAVAKAPTKLRAVPPHIARPTYAASGLPQADLKPTWMIEVKTAEEIVCMRESGRIAREVLDETGRAVRAGVTTGELDAIAHAACVARGAYPSPLNYQGFPKSLCTSVNEVICHGIPDDDQELHEGDIINLDVTVFYNGFHGDCSEMFFVGQVDDKARDLVQVTYEAWQEAIAFCEPGRAYKDIGGVIEARVAKHGYGTVHDFCGHGIGRRFHTGPNILHYKNAEPNGIMAVGHTFTIEPMICEGGNYKQTTLDDGWTAVTPNGGRSAQFEHTLLITETGIEPLTKKLPMSPKQPWE